MKFQMPKVLITDYVEDPVYEKSVLGDDVSLEANSDVQVLLVWRARIDGAIMDKYPDLKAIIRYGVGTENVDFDAAAQRGLVVCNTPDYGVDEVALTAISFLLYFDRAIATYNLKARRHTHGSWQSTEKHLRRAGNSTVGCIGAGRIGSAFLLKARALGFDTVLYDPYKPSGYEKVLTSNRVNSLEEFLSVSDYVSIHVILTEETAGMVDDAFVEQMKRRAVLINTSRGQVFDGLDFLVEPLKSGRIGGVALDVLPQEPPDKGLLIDAWRSGEDWMRGRVLINPHTAYFSQQAFQEMRTKAAQNALRILLGEAPLNRLN
ncbi:C-terminal binding protein [Gammaproteobacteria bacterium]|nr:C-terminal binding protein [Gammaproteobacteria bacterium]